MSTYFSLWDNQGISVLLQTYAIKITVKRYETWLMFSENFNLHFYVLVGKVQQVYNVSLSNNSKKMCSECNHIPVENTRKSNARLGKKLIYRQIYRHRRICILVIQLFHLQTHRSKYNFIHTKFIWIYFEVKVTIGPLFSGA